MRPAIRVNSGKSTCVSQGRCLCRLHVAAGRSWWTLPRGMLFPRNLASWGAVEPRRSRCNPVAVRFPRRRQGWCAKAPPRPQLSSSWREAPWPWPCLPRLPLLQVPRAWGPHGHFILDRWESEPGDRTTPTGMAVRWEANSWQRNRVQETGRQHRQI